MKKILSTSFNFFEKINVCLLNNINPVNEHIEKIDETNIIYTFHLLCFNSGTDILWLVSFIW
jgi:hypothetical protein